MSSRTLIRDRNHVIASAGAATSIRNRQPPPPAHRPAILKHETHSRHCPLYLGSPMR